MPSNAGPGLRLGYDSYTLNAYGWTAIQHLDYAARQKLDSVHLSDSYNYESLEPAYLQRVKDHAQRLGVTIDGGLGCICPSAGKYNTERFGDPVQWILKGLRANKAAGSNIMRCYLGTEVDRAGPIPIEQHMETTLKILKAVRTQALDLGVKIALENHGDMQARELRTLIEAAGTDFMGAVIDTGNAIKVAEDPMVVLEILAPRIILSHIKDFVIYEHPRGAATQLVALGEGTVDYVRFFERFRQLCPNVPVHVEMLTGGPPIVMPYLEPGFWKQFPKTNASEFAQVVALAKKGRPFMGTLLTSGAGQRHPEYTAALTEQRRIHLESSFEYARKVLKLGVRET